MNSTVSVLISERARRLELERAKRVGCYSFYRSQWNIILLKDGKLNENLVNQIGREKLEAIRRKMPMKYEEEENGFSAKLFNDIVGALRAYIELMTARIPLW